MCCNNSIIIEAITLLIIYQIVHYSTITSSALVITSLPPSHSTLIGVPGSKPNVSSHAPFNMMVAVSLYWYPDCAYTFIFRSFLNAPIRNPSFLFHPSYRFSVFDHIGIMPFYAFNSFRN